MKIEKSYGYIRYCMFNSNIFVDEFLVYKQLRGKGYSYKLAKFLPNKCWLLAWPNDGNKMSDNQLRNFYRKIGFKFYWCDKRACYYGFKGFGPTKQFWDNLLSPVP